MNDSKIPYNLIAEHAGVSVATVSRCFKQPNLVKGDTLKQIYAAIEDLGGTAPVQRPIITGGERRILAITPILNNPFYTDILSGIKGAAEKNGCMLIIMNETLSKTNIQSAARLISQADVHGVILMQRLEQPVLDYLKERTPIVQCSEFNDDSDVSYVTIDNLDATKKLMRYIFSTGKKRILMVNSDPMCYTYARLRLQGYKEALEQAGLPYDPDNIITIPDGSFNATVSAVSDMLKNRQAPEVIFCVSDIMAAAALRACALEGYRVPADIMIIGFDNVDISVMTTPNITTVSQPRYDIGFTACTQLLSMIANPGKPAQHFIMNTELILRESTDFQ